MEMCLNHVGFSQEAIISVYVDGSMYVSVQNCDGACVHLDQGIDVDVIQCVSELRPELNYCNFIMEKVIKFKLVKKRKVGMKRVMADVVRRKVVLMLRIVLIKFLQVCVLQWRVTYLGERRS